VLEDPKLRESALHLIGRARKAGVIISIDLSDPGIIQRNLSEMRAIVEKCADIVFVNEAEARALTGGLSAEPAAYEIARKCGTVVVKIGERGSIIAQHGKKDLIRVEGVKANAVDTTGAGDFYAAGFLYGLCKRKDLATCGKIGSIVAAKVVEQVGARPPPGLRTMLANEGLL
jgi:sugar/nucleoside kinase (ribokinase family)